MAQNLFDPQEMRALLQNWGLSKHAIALLSREPELVAHLQTARSLSDFSANYVPNMIEELFDDIPFRRWEVGKSAPTYERPIPENYNPPFVEYSFDDQMALFHIQGEIIVNRMAKMINLIPHIKYFTNAMEE